MHSLPVDIVLYEAGRGVRDPEGASRFVEQIERFLLRLERAPRARVALAVSGSTLERLATRNEAIRVLRQLGTDARLELISGGYASPWLPMLPEVDLITQLRNLERYIYILTGSGPRCVWLCDSVWDPAIIPHLARFRLGATWLQPQQLAAGMSSERSPVGIWSVERAGFRINVLPVEPSLEALWTSAALTPLVTALEEALQAETGPITIALELEERVMTEARQEVFFLRLNELLEALPLVKLSLPGELSEGAQPTGVCYPPASVAPELAARLLSPEHAARWRRARRTTTRKKGGRFLPMDLMGATWEHVIERYPEANRLHKRMILLSSRWQKAARLVKDRSQAGEDMKGFQNGLDRAQRLLFEVQNHAIFQPDPVGGFYRPEARTAILRRLIEVQRVVDGVLFPEARYVSPERLDVDRDGYDEVLLTTPRLSGVIKLHGGGLSELCFKPDWLPVIDLVGRRREPEHVAFAGAGVVLPKRKPRRRAVPGLEPELAPLAARIRYDRYPRGAFIEHFLGPAATPLNFYQCQYPEQGPYLQALYELNQLGYERRERRADIVLSRNDFVVDAVTLDRAPLRVEKIYRVDDRGSLIRVEYVLTNRRHEPMSFRFGVEVGFGSRIEPVTLVTAQGEMVAVAGEDADGMQMPGEMPDVMRLELVSVDTGTRLQLRTDTHTSWWWFPLETVTLEADGPALQRQGVVFMPVWDVSLWGAETRTIRLELEVHEQREAPSAEIVDDES